MRTLALLSLLVARTAWSSPCQEGLTGPAPLAVREAELAAPRSPCTERGLLVLLRAAAVVDEPEFYGTLGASAQLGVHVPWRGVEWSLSLRAIDWRFAQNASLKATETGVGPLGVAALWPLTARAFGQDIAIAPSIRVVLPFTDSTYDTPAGAADLALHLGAKPWRKVSLHGGGSLLAFGAGGNFREAAVVQLGASVLPWRWLVVHAGLEVQAGWFAWSALDHLLVRTGLRLVTRHAGRYDLSALWPLAGAERTDLVAGLSWWMPL